MPRMVGREAVWREMIWVQIPTPLLTQQCC